MVGSFELFCCLPIETTNGNILFVLPCCDKYQRTPNATGGPTDESRRTLATETNTTANTNTTPNSTTTPTTASTATEKHEDTERDEGRRYEQRESRTRSATWCSRTDAR
jgi:hypothetical protein